MLITFVLFLLLCLAMADAAYGAAMVIFLLLALWMSRD